MGGVWAVASEQSGPPDGEAASLGVEVLAATEDVSALELEPVLLLGSADWPEVDLEPSGLLASEAEAPPLGAKVPPIEGT